MSDVRYGLYSLLIPSQAVGSSLVFWDLFNGSDRDLTASSIMAIKDGVTAISGVIAIDLYLTRTTAIGTGGTANTEEGTSLTACTITMLQQRPLPTSVTARLTPSGGATAGAWIAQRQVFTEETSSANYEGLEFLPSYLTIPEGTGIRIVQGSTAGLGKIAFNVNFY